MRQFTLPSILALAGIFFITFGICTNKIPNQPAEVTPANVQYFNIGDTLLPDYACPDTLIVVNADGLNKGMALIEQGIIEATDYCIDSTLHMNCIIK